MAKFYIIPLMFIPLLSACQEAKTKAESTSNKEGTSSSSASVEQLKTTENEWLSIQQQTSGKP